MAKLMRPYWAAALVALLAVALYARTIGAALVWDDLTYLGAVRHYHGVEGTVRAVARPFLLSPEYYPPLAMLSFVASASSEVQHGINVVLHAVNAVLVFYCARALMPQQAAGSAQGICVPAVGALAFAAHPLAVEPVAWVSGRFDTLMCTFVLGTCLVVLGGELTRRRLAATFFLFACAMGSKESAIGLLAAFPFLLLLKRRLVGEEMNAGLGAPPLMRPWTVLCGGAVLYIAARLAVRRSLFVYDSSADPFAGGQVLDKLNVAALALLEFVRLITNPWKHSSPLHPFQYEMGRALRPQAAAMLAAVLALLALAALKKPRINFPLALLAALAMALPALHLFSFPNVGDIVSDRYALAPLALLLMGLAAVIGAWLARNVSRMGGAGRRGVAYAGVFCVLWMMALAAYTSATIPLWRNEVSLWGFAYRMAPDSARVHGNYIRALIGLERWEEADRELTLLLPRVADRLDLATITSWMLVRAKVGSPAEALEISRLADGQLNGGLPLHQQLKAAGDFYRARGLIEGWAGNWQNAARDMQNALEAQPSDMRAALQYAHALFMAGDDKLSEEVFEGALQDAPESMTASARKWRESWVKNNSGK